MLLRGNTIVKCVQSVLTFARYALMHGLDFIYCYEDTQYRLGVFQRYMIKSRYKNDLKMWCWKCVTSDGPEMWHLTTNTRRGPDFNRVKELLVVLVVHCGWLRLIVCRCIRRRGSLLIISTSCLSGPDSIICIPSWCSRGIAKQRHR